MICFFRVVLDCLCHNGNKVVVGGMLYEVVAKALHLLVFYCS